MMSIRDEIKQSRPFEDPVQEAYLGVVKTAADLEHDLSEMLREHDITPTQYNVLRILRGAGEEGLCRGEVGERMLTPVPDATRLLDRLQSAGLIQRSRDTEDRRFVRTRITKKGLRMLAELDDPVLDLHREQFGPLTKTEVGTLIGLLDQLRGSD